MGGFPWFGLIRSGKLCRAAIPESLKSARLCKAKSFLFRTLKHVRFCK